MRNDIRPTRLIWFVMILLGISIGVAFRLFIMHSPILRAINSDEAVVGLEAMKMLQGHFQVFFWRQPYGGTLETALVAIVFALFGPGVVTLSMVPLVLDSIATLLTWRIARYFLSEFEAVVASIIFFIAPASVLWLSTKETGFYWVTMDLGLLIILIGIRQVVLNSVSPDASTNTPNDTQNFRRFLDIGEWALVGVLLGLGWWSSPDIMYFFAPISLWVVFKYPKSLFRLPLVVIGAAIGSFPWWWVNLHTNFLSLKIPPSPVPHNSYLDHLYNFFNGDLPLALGLRVPYRDPWLFPGMKLGYFIVIIPILFAGLVIAFKRFNLLVLIIVVYPFILAISPFSWYVGDGRYVFFLAPFLAMLLSIILNFFGKYIITGIGVGTIALLSMTGLFMMNNIKFEPAPNSTPVPASFKPLEKLLLQHHIYYVYANYWVAYRLIFETNQKIIAASNTEVRYPYYNQVVAQRPNSAHVFLKGSPNLRPFVTAMAKKGIPLAIYRTKGFIIYQPIVSSST